MQRRLAAARLLALVGCSSGGGVPSAAANTKAAARGVGLPVESK